MSLLPAYSGRTHATHCVPTRDERTVVMGVLEAEGALDAGAEDSQRGGRGGAADGAGHGVLSNESAAGWCESMESGGYSAGIRVIQHYSGAIQVLEWLVEAPGSKETLISPFAHLLTV